MADVTPLILKDLGSGLGQITEMAPTDKIPKGLLDLTAMEALSVVPITNQGSLIFVTAPHDRFMRWNGTKYVRANWDRPGRIFYTHHNNASEPGALPVRADVSYNKVDYPDLCEALGITGTGTFTLLEIRGEFLRVLDNGRGIDVGRTYGSAQAATRISNNPSANGVNLPASNSILEADATESMGTVNLLGAGGSTSTVSAGRVRPRSIALPAWVTF